MAAATALIALGTGCGTSAPGAGGSPSSPAVSSGAASGSAGQSDATPAAPGPGEFVNPVVSEDFPDPGALRVGKTFYLYATQGNGENIQVRTSPDLVTWTAQPDALPTLGRWAGAGKTWAPEVLAVDGSYVMFYTAADIASGRQCIGRAVAKSPGGPFTDTSAKPLVCQADEGGSIDASPFRAPDGSLYLYWKNDGNCCGLPVTLYGQEMDPAAATLTGRPVALLSNTQAWQGNLIEAPEMLSRNGSYYMFYAANDYGSDAYAEGFATCTGPLGPCKDNPEPLLKTTADAAGPGHAFLLTVGKETWILYHAWPPDAIGSARPGRQVWLDKVEWTAAGPEVDGPDAEPQPRPDVSVGG